MSGTSRLGGVERRKAKGSVSGIGGLHARMRFVLGDMTCAELGRRTGTHPETVRRYRGGQMPSLEFVAAMCQAMGVSADWLLSGQGEQFVRGRSGTGAGLAAALDELAQKVRMQGLEALEGQQKRWPRLASANGVVLVPAWSGSAAAIGEG